VYREKQSVRNETTTIVLDFSAKGSPFFTNKMRVKIQENNKYDKPEIYLVHSTDVCISPATTKDTASLRQ